MGLDSLAQCDACHAPRDTASDGQGALASSPLRIDRRDPPTPESDFERVLAGGALFTTACAGCHGSHRDGPARVATPMLDAGPATNAPIGPLSDEQVAALVAFLRCHAPALPSKPLHQRATL